MKKTIIALSISALFLSACLPFSGNRLEKALTPTPPATAAETIPEDPTATNPPLTEADIIAPSGSGRDLQPQLDDIDIPLEKIVALLPPDAIPAILPDETPNILVSAGEANAMGINPAVRVIGVEINGDSRAYPIPFLSRHEIINDEVGGKLIAATW